MLTKLLSMKVYFYVGAAAFAAGFAYGFFVEAKRFAEFRGAVEAVGVAQEERTKERVLEFNRIKQEVERDYQARLVASTAERNAALERLRLDARRRIVPAPAPSAAGAVPSGRTCHDAEELDRRIRADYEGLLGALAALLGRDQARVAEEAWGRWARSVGSCPAL
jgi:hypothetical protein